MKAIILGSQGQLGKALALRFPDAATADRDELDITSLEALEAFDWSDIDTILNAAAYTNVDGAESPEGRVAAWKINAQGVGYLSVIATRHDMTLVHLSSDYVFDGSESSHTETEPFSPLGSYAQTKAAGDIAAAITPKHYILRVTWLIGDGPNFVRTMMGLADRNISPEVVSDQVGRLTFTEQLVDGIEMLLEGRHSYGTYNLTNEGSPASWAEITREIFEVLGRGDLKVSDITTENYFKNKPGSSRRPLQSTLDLTKIKAIGLEPEDWKVALRRYIETERDNVKS